MVKSCMPSSRADADGVGQLVVLALQDQLPDGGVEEHDFDRRAPGRRPA